jgi:hypothetical protein
MLSTYASGTLDTVIHAMLDKSRKKLIMAAIKSNALVAWMFASQRVETETGANITNPLIVGRNSNISATQYYNPIPIGQTNEVDTLRYSWSRVVGTVIISEQEEDENTGDTAIFKIMKMKMQVLEESITERFSTYLYGVGSGLEPNGLGNLIPDDPTTGSLGGISRSAQNQWRTSAYQFSGTLDASNIEEAFDDIMMDLTLKGEKPSIIICGRNIMRLYRQAARDRTMFALSETKNGQKMFDLGFGGVSFNGIPMIYDEDCGVNRAYFINDKYLRLHMLKGVNMRTKKLNSPWNLDASGSRVTWQGQLCLWKAYRTHAVLRNGTTG